jgi:hypothetical protein
MLQSVRSPTPIPQNKREEEPTLGWSTRFPDLERSGHGHTTTKHAKIARLHGVDPVATPVPPELISHTLGDSKSLHTVCNRQQLLNCKSIKIRGMSSSHPPSRASLTDLTLESLFGISAKRCGAKSFRRPSGSQLSNQKKVQAPSPTIEEVAASKISVTLWGI